MTSAANAQPVDILTTTGGTRIFVERGTKSPLDFKVRYQEPGARSRTPKHIHFVVDLYLKAAGNPDLTREFVDYLNDRVLKVLHPATAYPPTLQIHDPKVIERFTSLNKFGEYDVEFILVAVELVMIQERTNYPNGTMTLDVYEEFRGSKLLGGKEGIFSVVGTATFTGPG